MVLSLMRKHAKSLFIKVLLGIIVVVFIFFYGYSMTSKDVAKVATVNGEDISSKEYETAYNEIISNLQNQYQSAWNDNLIKSLDLKNRTLESLIEKKLMSQEAKKIGLDITDKEVQDTISNYQAFQSGGKFDNARYNSLLAQQRMTAQSFESSMSQSLLKQKLVQFLSTFLVVSDQEILDQYTFSNEKTKVSFARFSPDNFRSSTIVDKTMMEKFFGEHKESYRIPAQVKIAYMAMSPSEFSGQVNINEEEIKTYYEDNIDSFKEPKSVKASHILFKLAEGATKDEENKVKEKAESILKKARAGEDFAKLAKEYSDDTQTKENGGELGYLQKGQTTETFENAAFNLKKGEISEPIKTSYGYHIIKVEDVKDERVLDFQEAHDTIKNKLISNESKDLADEKLLSIVDQMPADTDLVQYAGKNGIGARTTDYFSTDAPVVFLEGQTKALDMIFSLQNMEMSDVIEINNVFYLVQVIDKKQSSLPKFDEVSTKVEQDYREYLALQKAKAAAEEYLSKLKSGSDWSVLAQTRGITTQTTDFFTRLEFPKELENLDGLQKMSFHLNKNDRYPDSILENDTGAFVIRWEDSKGIDQEQYKKEMDSYRNNIISAKQQYIFSSWLERLKKNAEIDRSPFEKNYK
jgi:peptidyl-prolyl cis-trans isomerase D